MSLSFNSIVFDMVMLAVIVLAVIIGKSKGLFRMLYSLLIIFVAIFLANLFSPYVAKGIEQLKVKEKLQVKLSAAIESVVLEENETTGLGETLDKLKLPDSVKKYITEKSGELAEKKGKELADRLSVEITVLIIRILGYVAVALIVIIALVAISVALKIVRKLPVLETIDAAGGGIAGLLTGVLVVFVVCLCLYAYALSHAGGLSAEIAGQSLFMKLFDKVGAIIGVIK